MIGKNIKQDFAIFKRKIEGQPIVYLDSAATSLKPKPVVEAVRKYYEEYTANIFRGIYKLSEEATMAYEGARGKMAKFISAKQNEIVFVRNATEALNMVMYSWGLRNFTRGDEIVISVMEHHANLVTWQVLAGITEAKLKVVQINEKGLLDMEALGRALTKKTRLVAVTHVSNVLGTINDIERISKVVKQNNKATKLLIDGAQAVPHMKVDMQKLGCDWYAFSGHKMLGPSGIGVLWGREELLEEMAPFMYGGEMISEVSFDKAEFKEAPYKFEAGTPHIAGAIGLGAAVDYLDNLEMEKVRAHECELVRYGLKELNGLRGVTVYGPNDVGKRGGVISFTVDGIHPHDVAQVLDSDNVYVRAGHHCAMPLHTYLGLMATVRASFYVYNTKEDVDKLVEGVEKAMKMFKV